MRDINPKDFEKRVGQFLVKRFGQTFRETSLKVGFDKCHKFDLVSEDKSIVVECKKYIWTKSGNAPSAKFSTALEAALYLSRVNAQHKIMVFLEDVYDGRSLVDEFVRRYDGLLDDIEVWAYVLGEDENEDSIRIVRTAGKKWEPTLESC